MEQGTGIALSLGLMLALWAVSQSAGASLEYGSNEPAAPDDNWWPDVTPSTEKTLNDKIDALLETVAHFESDGQYNVINGGAHFSHYDKHPFDVGGDWYARKAERLAAGYSTASGKYQFILATWLRLARKVGLSDFSPASQEAAARGLLAETGAIAALEQDNMALAFARLSSQWDSMPGPKSRQPQAFDVVLADYQDNLG